jgi:hypothetical protein
VSEFGVGVAAQFSTPSAHRRLARSAIWKCETIGFIGDQCENEVRTIFADYSMNSDA